MVRRLFIFFLLVFSFLFLFPQKIFSEGEFKTSVNVNYEVRANGITHVTHNISLENLFSEYYANSYQMSFKNIEADNISASENGKALDYNVKTNGDETVININFNNAVVGKSQTRNFSVSFDNPIFAQRTGEIWEISIPRLQSDTAFDTYDMTLVIPQSFGNEAFIAPKPINVNYSDGQIVYHFDKDSVVRTGVSAGFGLFQVFSFSLNYHLENSENKTSEVEIALPPDTSSQKMYYSTINPVPENIRIDVDGNWLGSYILTSHERLDIKADGFVQIFASTRPFPKPSDDVLQQDLMPSQYWQIDDQQIKELAQKYTTPKEIYDFVSSYLSYDYKKIGPDVVRMGAVQALANPQNAICMEYTDLFVAIARSAGIPAREIEGYAYTENKNIQPLSLVDDVLHAWPEYWDKNTGVWVPVDPTWGSTTGGIDYFSKLDLRHFAFVIHGQNPVLPYPPGSYKLGSNPQKDVYVNFSQLPVNKTSHPEIEVDTRELLPFFPYKLNVTINNPGPVSLDKISTNILFDGISQKQDYQEILPPFGHVVITTEVPFSFLGKSTPSRITITAGDKQINVPGFKKQVISYELIALSLLVIFLVVYILIRLKKFNLNAIFSKQPKKDSRL
jgi:transglutaminase-like putative cysteine protease